MDDPLLVTITLGVAIGAAFGAVVHKTNYCIMGAVADYAISGDLRRMRAWMLSIAVAVLCSQALQLFSAVDLSATAFRSAQLPLGGLVVGGLMFGFGMVIACGCSSRSLVNAASGDLRALVTLLILGITAYITMRGLLAYPRLWFTQFTTIDVHAFGLDDPGLGPILSALSGLSLKVSIGIMTALVSIALASFALVSSDFRRQQRLLFASTTLGALIAAGWFVTGVLGADEFEPRPLQSFRFVAPIGDSLQYLMLFTGTHASFGVATVGGVVLGAFASSLVSGTFRLRAFEDLHDMRRYLIGGALMGIGGVLCLGCTVGQGMSGVSTLALGSFIATAAIIAGGIVGIRYLEQGSLVLAMRALLQSEQSNESNAEA